MGGRPKKYIFIVSRLDDQTLYSPAKISHFAASYYSHLNPEVRRNRLQRIRITMARFATKHRFPHEGDGMVTIKGQAPTPGWYGWRWKETYGRQD